MEDSAIVQEPFARVRNPPKVYPTGYVKQELSDPLPYYTVGGAGINYPPEHPPTKKVRQLSQYLTAPHLVPRWRKESRTLQSPLIHDAEAARLYGELGLFSSSRIFGFSGLNPEIYKRGVTHNEFSIFPHLNPLSHPGS
ncbi:unnamed protein product [Schistocephalus solidus]|uniref:NADH-ubiquinone oxidoreductase subunit B14.5a n=1 Tax=Schistocephalus solidus TaxID=70667 RepID=A0A183SLK8_SCHSO|nr:unnamed protein product [Schistocephalus solidus]